MCSSTCLKSFWNIYIFSRLFQAVPKSSKACSDWHVCQTATSEAAALPLWMTSVLFLSSLWCLLQIIQKPDHRQGGSAPVNALVLTTYVSFPCLTGGDLLLRGKLGPRSQCRECLIAGSLGWCWWCRRTPAPVRTQKHSCQSKESRSGGSEEDHSGTDSAVIIHRNRKIRLWWKTSWTPCTEHAEWWETWHWLNQKQH